MFVYFIYFMLYTLVCMIFNFIFYSIFVPVSECEFVCIENNVLEGQTRGTDSLG